MSMMSSSFNKIDTKWAMRPDRTLLRTGWMPWMLGFCLSAAHISIIGFNQVWAKWQWQLTDNLWVIGVRAEPLFHTVSERSWMKSFVLFVAWSPTTILGLFSFTLVYDVSIWMLSFFLCLVLHTEDVNHPFFSQALIWVILSSLRIAAPFIVTTSRDNVP